MSKDVPEKYKHIKSYEEGIISLRELQEKLSLRYFYFLKIRNYRIKL